MAVSGSRDVWESNDARVVRAVAGLAIVAATSSNSSVDDDASAAALAALVALPRALSALRASHDLAGGCLPQLVEAVRACSSAILASKASAPLVEPREASLLAAAAAAAAAPPPEALFASVGGNPLLVGEIPKGGDEAATAAAARREWRERERACAAAAGAAVAAVGEERLREAAGKGKGGAAAASASPPQPAAPPPPPPRPPVSSLWDITGNASSSLPQASASAVASAGARSRGPLIEVIDDDGGGESFDEEEEDEEEEEEEEEEEDKKQEKEKAAAAAAAASSAAAEVIALESAQARALCLAALYSRDEELGCSWANDFDSGNENGSSSSTASASFPFLSPLEPLPRAAARLLPRALQPLYAVLLAQVHWREGIDSVKMRAFEGPGVFERSCAAYTLSVLLRWVVSDDHGESRSRSSSSSSVSLLSSLAVALPALLAAADDPAPSVARIGLLSLARLAAFLRPEDLGQHPAEVSLLAAAARKAALGSDERAAGASTAAAAALAVALDNDDDDEDGEGGGGGGDKLLRARRPAECCASVFPDLLDDAQRHAQEVGRSSSWLSATRPVFERLGLGLVPLLSTRVLPLLVRWLLMSPGEGNGGGGGGPSSSSSGLLILQTEAAKTLTAITKRAWPRVGARAHALPLWGAAAEAFRRSGGGGGSFSTSTSCPILDLASALRAAARAVEEAPREEESEDMAAIEESLSGVEGGAALLEAVKKREKEKQKT